MPSGPSNSIVVDSGELHITSTLEMLPGAYIWVKPGATLRVSAKITGACGQMWRGVIVQGDDKPQLPVYQGRVIVDNNGIIEHAVCGIEAGAVGGNGAPFTGPGGGNIACRGGGVFPIPQPYYRAAYPGLGRAVAGATGGHPAV